MSKRTSRRKPAAEDTKRRSRRFYAFALAVITFAAAALIAGTWTRRTRTDAERYTPRPRGEVTFTKEIAPIIFGKCAPCHRPGQSAPFALLSYEDVRKRAQSIAEVTAERVMPPWLPEPGHGEFVGERRLSAEQIGLIQQWVAEGAIEGTTSDLPPLPEWSGDWQLGKPDLVLTMPEPYKLAPEGRDVYRNFVLSVPLTHARYVRGVEFRPGNARIVHHAFVKLDRTTQSRRQDADDAGPGFGGMNVAAEMPGGHFLGWQPGRVPMFQPDGLAWQIDPGNDLVLQLHLTPSGKPELLQCSVGLYFTDRPPTNTCFKISLASFTIDIPAGARDHVVEDSFVLPVDVQVLGVFPHAHYLAQEMQGWAVLPDGTRRSLLWIKQWDFNWQGDYRYAAPVFLPRGSVLSMRYTYDNSTNNVSNPNHPPRPVVYGPQSSDEMAELAFQFLPRNKTDYDLLARETGAKQTRAFIEADRFRIRKNPKDAEAHAELGLLLLGQNQLAEAERHLRVAVAVKPDLPAAHYNLGLVLRRYDRLAEARAEFETTVRLDPRHFRAHGNLGIIFFQQGQLDLALVHFQAASRLSPEDPLIREGLDQTMKALQRIQ